jgi:hypothetical protein
MPAGGQIASLGDYSKASIPKYLFAAQRLSEPKPRFSKSFIFSKQWFLDPHCSIPQASLRIPNKGASAWAKIRATNLLILLLRTDIARELLAAPSRAKRRGLELRSRTQIKKILNIGENLIP